MKYLIGSLLTIVILVIAGLIFIYSGTYNMSTNAHHSRITLWAINTLLDNSIKNHADDNIRMPDLNDSSLVKLGFTHYREMCVGCHGGPGIDKLAKGFYPDPPLLTKTADDWTPQQLFWILKNGIKMSAMPAFGATHSDEMIWAMVSFTMKVPKMTPAQYKQFDKKVPPAPDD